VSTKTDEQSERTENALSATVTAMTAFNPITSAAWLEIVTECAQFNLDRLQQVWDAQKSLLDCRSPADMLRLQTDFCRKAIEQYTNEADHLLGMMSKATAASIEEATSGRARRYDDIPV
jgi:hypothetical protein